jgi:chemotaxis protein CheY-P-specific phosphatase CheC
MLINKKQELSVYTVNVISFDNLKTIFDNISIKVIKLP